MKKIINILIIEDSENDALLVLREIERGGYDPKYERVDTARDLQRALSGSEWDIVISDHQMPGFNSKQALAIFKKSGRDIPFIIVSGTIDEDAAVAVMKAGADDYLRKDNLKRLVPAIEREMADAEHRRGLREAETMLNQERDFTNRIIESLRDGFSVIDPAGVHVLVNNALCAMTGFSREELIGAGPPHPYWPEEEIKSITGAFQKTLAKKFDDLELVFKKKDGRRFPVIVSPSVLMNDQGKAIQYFALIKDITERKQRELKLARSEARYKAVVEDTPLLMCRMILDSTITFTNHEFGRYFGAAPYDLIGTSFLDHVCAGDQEGMKANLASLNKQNVTSGCECRAVLPGKGERLLRWINRAVLEGERLVEYQCIGEDITEQKQMEEELQRQLKELKRWQNVMLGREDRVMELKKEVNDLLKETGRPARYGGT